MDFQLLAKGIALAGCAIGAGCALIAGIVNKDNAVEDITMDEIKSIYTGSKTTWSDESK